MIDHVERTGADLGKLHTIIVGGSSAPPATIRWFRERGIRVNHLWGMTEMSPVGTVGAPPANWDTLSEEEQIDYMSRPGRSMFGVELRVIDDDGNVLPRDGKSSGRLQTRGPRRGAALFQAGPGLRRRGQLVRYRRHRRDPSRQLAAAHRPRQGRDQVGRRVDQLDRDRECGRGLSGCGRGGGDRRSRTPNGTSGRCCSWFAIREARSAKAKSVLSSPARWRNGGCPTRSSSSTSCRTPRRGKLSKKDLRDQYRDYRFADAEAMVGRRFERTRERQGTVRWTFAAR